MDLYKGRGDAVSITASLICLVHCVILPVFVSTLPFLGWELMENIWIEAGTLLLSAFIGGWAIWSGCKTRHQKRFVLYFFLTGFILMVLGNILSSELIERCLKLSGSALIIVAHIYNWKLSRNCSVCHEE